MRRFLIAAVVVASMSASTLHAQTDAKPIKALLVIGGCCHDYNKQKDILAKGLAARANVDVTIAYEKDTGTKKLNPVYENPDWSKGYDVIIHDECSADVSDKDVVNRILQPHRDGLPAVLLHCGMHCYRVPKSDEWFKFTGLTTRNHGPQLPIEITFNPDSPITKNLANWKTINEELYNNENLWKTATPLARGKQQKNDYVVAWTNMYNDKTKVFATTLGHNNATVEDPRYLDLVANGLLWATGHLTDDGRPAAGYGPRK
jgi:type 1 glutamine amidotransferase